MEYSLTLLKNWLNNLQNNIINDEILFLVFHNCGPHKINKEKFIEHFLSKIDSNSYHIVDINEIQNIEELQDYKGKKSIIIIGRETTSIDKIAYTNFKIILYCNTLLHYFNSKTINKLIEINGIDNLYYCYHITVIKKTDPLKIIHSFNYTLISKTLEELFSYTSFCSPFFSPLNILRSDRSKYYTFNILLDIFQEDIMLLIEEKKLTARLAIAIYKVCTLKFDDNNTTIGTFFHKKLGIKSKTYKTPKKYYYSQILKVYDLTSMKK